AAHFTAVWGVATDGAGNVYVADETTIRKVVTATGAVTTLAGVAGMSGTTDGTGASARLSAPSAVVSDGAGNLYVADDGAIRKIVIATGAVTTLAGAGGKYGTADGTGAAARFAQMNGIASDGAGELYVADAFTVRKIAVATGTVSTLLGVAGRGGI